MSRKNAAVIFVCVLAVSVGIFAVSSIKEKKVESTSAALTTETTTKPSEYIDAYITVLREVLYSEDLGESASFSFDYIDSDDIPELIISKGSYHGTGARVYTFDGQKAKEVADGGGFGRIAYVPKSGVIIPSFTQNGTLTISVYKLENGNCNLVWSGRDTSGLYGEDDAAYLSDGKDVSKEEYERKYDENVPEESVFSLNADDTEYIGKGVYLLNETEILKLESEPIITAHRE